MSEYPPRSYKSKDSILGIKTCECGHIDFSHDAGFFSRGCCLDCLCPKFKEEVI